MAKKQRLVASTAALLLTAPSLTRAETVETRIGKLELQVGGVFRGRPG